jgi:ferredoxin
MAADVFFWPLPETTGAELAPPDPRPGLRRLVAALGLEGAARSCPGWALKVHLGAPGRPAAVAPAWAREVGAALAGPAGTNLPAGLFATDTLSIATRGLDTPDSLRETARAKGFRGPVTGGGIAGGEVTGGGATGGGLTDRDLPFVVGDDPSGSPDLPIAALPGTALAGHAVAGALASVRGLCLLNPVRSHPHLGVVGAVAGLGLDLATRSAKLRLHQGIRPKVDTPLCAGCGSCLDVCLYDAIVIKGGRALIDHRLCTGCGECMGVCFMAGIAPEEAAGLAAFHGAVADAATATSAGLGAVLTHPIVYLNIMIQLDAHGTAAKARRRLPLPGIGILASVDPVAADAAAFELLARRLGGPLNQWSGYAQSPEPLLDRAERLGLGARTHRLVEV